MSQSSKRDKHIALSSFSPINDYSKCVGISGRQEEERKKKKKRKEILEGQLASQSLQPTGLPALHTLPDPDLSEWMLHLPLCISGLRHSMGSWTGRKASEAMSSHSPQCKLAPKLDSTIE